MKTLESQAAEFFKQYALQFNEAIEGEDNAEKTALCFSTCFVGANPAALVCGQNDDKFRSSIRQGYEFYKNIGIQRMEILAVETTDMDGIHCMCKVTWRSVYQSKKGMEGGIEFDNFYFLRQEKDGLKIFGYTTGDEEGALRDHGLI